MDIAQLEAFERVVREGSFTRAADDLGITQPSVSARISALEAELGGQLFERGGRQLRLTPLGEAFLPYAERALTVLDDGLQAVRSFKDGKLGRVTIAALDTPATYLLPEPMEHFRAKYPAVDFTIRLRITREILDMLYKGDTTLGLLGAPLWDKGIHVHAHIQEPVQATVRVDHPLAVLQKAQTELMLHDLYNYTMYRVTLNRSVTAVVEGIAEHARRGSGGAVIFIPALMALRMLLKGQGVALLPENFVLSHPSADQLTFLKIADLPILYNEYMLVSLAGRDLDPPSAAFVEILRAHWRPILI